MVGGINNYISSYMNTSKTGVAGYPSSQYSSAKQTSSKASGDLSVFNSMSGNLIKSFDSSSASFFKSLSTSLNALKTSANAVNTSGKNSLFNQSLNSSDNSVATGNSLMFSKLKPNYSVEVSNIATKQESSSGSMDSSARSNLGGSSLTISSGNSTKTFGFAASGNNKQSLEGMASQINASGLNVTASVVTKDSKSTLTLTSKETGAANSFGVQFNQGTGTQSALNFDTKTQAGDAKYSIDGENYTSSVNTVNVPNSTATLTLKGEGKATMQSGLNGDKILSAVDSLVSNYNSALENIGTKSNPGNGVYRSVSMLMSATGTGKQLSKIGITQSNSGKLTVDSKKLLNAVQNDPIAVKNALSGSGSFASNVSRATGTISRIPQASFTDFSSLQYSSANAYSGMSSSLLNVGMLFNIGI